MTPELVRGDTAAWATLTDEEDRRANLEHVSLVSALVGGAPMPVRPAEPDGDAVTGTRDDAGHCTDTRPALRALIRGAADQRDVIGQLAALCRTCPVRATCLRTGRRAHGNGLHGGVVLLVGRVAPGAPEHGTPAPMTPGPHREHDGLTPTARRLAARRARVAELVAAGLTSTAIAAVLGIGNGTVTSDRRALLAEQSEPGPTPASAPEPAANQTTATQPPRLTQAQRRRRRGTRWRYRQG
jgi:DNA-binding CsgD family transcriptional regulator